MSAMVLHLSGTESIFGTISCQAHLYTGLVRDFFVNNFHL